MRNIIVQIILVIILFSSCIGDDYVDDRVDPILRITNSVDSLAIDSSYQFNFSYLNNVGKEEAIIPIWSSSAEDVININDKGLATALSAGNSNIQVEYNSEDGTIIDMIQIGVGENTVETEVTGRRGSVKTTSSYKLHGDFTLTELVGGGVTLAFGDDYEASTALPGLYVYLSNNPSTISGALEIQAVKVFSGAHSYDIVEASLEEYGYVLYFCKPFNVKVGHGEIVE